ncbi:MAG: GMC oxidoreductase [Pseudonocardiaceae bacterium]
MSRCCSRARASAGPTSRQPLPRFPRNGSPSGTWWMGEQPDDSVTDLDARLHIASNVHVGGRGDVPLVGFVEPTLPAMVLGRRLANQLVKRVCG